MAEQLILKGTLEGHVSPRPPYPEVPATGCKATSWTVIFKRTDG